jgi:hypothetical protein
VPLDGVASFWREAIPSKMMVRTIIKLKRELRNDNIKNTHLTSQRTVVTVMKN